jgi:hypothetical protein
VCGVHRSKDNPAGVSRYAPAGSVDDARSAICPPTCSGSGAGPCCLRNSSRSMPSRRRPRRQRPGQWRESLWGGRRRSGCRGLRGRTRRRRSYRGRGSQLSPRRTRRSAVSRSARRRWTWRLRTSVVGRYCSMSDPPAAPPPRLTDGVVGGWDTQREDHPTDAIEFERRLEAMPTRRLPARTTARRGVATREHGGCAEGVGRGGAGPVGGLGLAGRGVDRGHRRQPSRGAGGGCPAWRPTPTSAG